MPGLEQQQPTFQFGVFELNPRTGELWKHGIKLKLQDQPLQILTLLLEHPGKVVTREDIQKRLWPAGTYVDFDNAINNAVRKLRDALGDSAETPRFVETLARRGYRFIYPVSSGNPSPQRNPPIVLGEMPILPVGEKSKVERAEAPLTEARRNWPSPWVVRSGGMVLLLLVGAILWLFGLRLKHPAASLSVAPLTSSLGLELNPCFSPDGNQIAYTWNGPRQDNFDLYVKLIGGGEPLRLTSDPAPDVSPAWSPDGRQIAFVRQLSQEKAAVILLPALGGGERKLTEIPSYAGNLFAPGVTSHLLAWSRDGEWLVIAEPGAPGGGTSLVAYSLRTGERRAFTGTHSAYGDANPAFSPDGRLLAFSRGDTVDVSDLYLLPLSPGLRPTGVPKRITVDHRSTGQPTWSEEGRSLIFTSNRGGTLSLWRVPVDRSSPPEPVAFAGDGVAMPVVAPHAHRLAYVRSVSDINIWQVTVPAPGQPATPPVPVIASASINEMPQISPDGRKVVFSSTRSGAQEIWMAGSDGSHPVQMTSFGRNSGTPRWSPEGTQIVFDSNASGLFQIYVMSAEGGTPRRVTTGPSENFIPSWSHDGQWIYFCSSQTGRLEIWKIGPDGGDLQQVTKNGGRVAFGSWDGQWLYYRKADAVGPIWRMPVAGGAETVLVSAPVAGRNFVVTGKGIYFMRYSGAVFGIEVYRFDTGAVESVVTLRGHPAMGLAVSPEEKRILYSQVDHEGKNIMLVENYH